MFRSLGAARPIEQQQSRESFDKSLLPRRRRTRNQTRDVRSEGLPRQRAEWLRSKVETTASTLRLLS